ncbi:MAG TPA: tetratricopeptide repeat protein [Blastocatellia bacterium]|nr:tetratricopeptide repeat protein [Blastocatellia bacterium]
MKSSRLGFAALAVCISLAVFTPGVLAADKWINLASKHFNVVSNAGERETRELALKLEQFRYLVSKIRNTGTVSPVPLTVVVFKGDGSFKPFKPLYNGKPANVAGYFQRGEDENLIALNIAANELRPLDTIYHEYTHLLTGYTRRRLPTWLAEGIAEFYSSFEVKGKQATLGAPISNHVFLLRDRTFIPLQSLFKVDHNSPAYNERDKQGIFYAESWALAHYLMLGEKSVRQPQLIEFLKLLDSGMSSDEAFPKAFKTDFASIEKELRRYINNDSYPVIQYTLDKTQDETEVAIRPMAEGEVQFHLGNLLLRSRRLDEAEKYFNQSAALDPASPRPYEGLGFLAIRRGNFAEARRHLSEAAARGSQNHLAHYYYAEALHREAMGGGSAISRFEPDALKTMTEELQKAIKLMPGFAAPYQLLAFLHLVTGENVDEGLKNAETALKLEPQNKRFALTLAQLQFRKSDFAAARKTLEPLVDSDDDPGLRSSAQSLVSQIERMESLQQTSRVRGNEPPPPPAAGDIQRPRLKGRDEGRDSDSRPIVRLEGADVADGVLTVIECEGTGLVLVLKTASGTSRFRAADPPKLLFYSQDPQAEVSIACGPINLRAFVHFKPTTGDSKFAGDAVAVEFRK